MRVIIIGGGKMVYFLARQFASKGYHLTIINRSAGQAELLSRQLKATVVLGDGSIPSTLEEAGARRADVVLSLTPHDQDNLVACQLAQQRFGVPKTIALVNDPENEPIFKKLGITATFSATQIIVKLIEEQAQFEDITNLIPVAEGRIHITEVTLAEDAPAVNCSLQALNMPRGALIANIIRNGQTIVPRGESQLQAGDRLILISQPENYGQALRSLAGETV
ncbi:MAG: potassium channel family protein [Anaerolineae bacterium]